MKKWTVEEEGAALAERFKDINRAAFARETKIKGGQAIVYQHIKGIRPISLDAALIYAKYFSCSLAEISPRLDEEIQAATRFSQESPSAGYAVREEAAGYVSSGARWPFKEIDEAKVRALSKTDLVRLETAIRIAAAQAGLDVVNERKSSASA